VKISGYLTVIYNKNYYCDKGFFLVLIKLLFAFLLKERIILWLIVNIGNLSYLLFVTVTQLQKSGFFTVSIGGSLKMDSMHGLYTWFLGVVPM